MEIWYLAYMRCYAAYFRVVFCILLLVNRLSDCFIKTREGQYTVPFF